MFFVFRFIVFLTHYILPQVESEENKGDLLKGGYVDNSTSVKIVPCVSCYYLIILVPFLGFKFDFGNIK